MLSDTYFYCQFMINNFIQYIKTSILQLPLLSLELELLQPELLQLPDPPLREPVADGGGRVALPALGTLRDPGPAAGADEVLMGAGEDFSSGTPGRPSSAGCPYLIVLRTKNFSLREGINN